MQDAAVQEASPAQLAEADGEGRLEGVRQETPLIGGTLPGQGDVDVGGQPRDALGQRAQIARAQRALLHSRQHQAIAFPGRRQQARRHEIQRAIANAAAAARPPMSVVCSDPRTIGAPEKRALIAPKMASASSVMLAEIRSARSASGTRM